MLKNAFYIMLKLFFGSRTISPKKVALSPETNRNPNPNRGGLSSGAIVLIPLFSFLKYLYFCPDFVEKRIDKKPKLIFKIYDVAAWITNNCNTYIV